VDAIRVLTGVRRRIACLHINGLLVADVRHPRVLRLAGVDREELALPGLHAGRRLAAAARRIPGVGGLSVPPLTPGASDALVIFPESVAGHVELVHAPVQTVTPAFPSTRRPGSPPEAEPVVIDFARLRPGVRRPNVRSRALSNGT
jgi:hypothetical protein